MSLIDCKVCPISEVCSALEIHKNEHRVILSSHEWREPNNICYDENGKYIEINFAKCPLYQVAHAIGGA